MNMFKVQNHIYLKSLLDVLVAPIRSAQRLLDLTAEEISDLFMVVQKVQDVAEREYHVCSSTITVQDGIDAGQSIKVSKCQIPYLLIVAYRY